MNLWRAGSTEFIQLLSLSSRDPVAKNRSAAAPGSLERRIEARRLTALMEDLVPFTYLRLGDGELHLLLEWQEGNKPKLFQRAVEGPLEARTWLREVDYARLLSAFERCSYLDTYDRSPYSAANVCQLHLDRDGHGTATPHPDLSQIVYEWVFCELPAYITRHNCVIAGPEGPLLRELLADRRYHEAVGEFWPSSANLTCVGIRDDGRLYWNNLADIKSDLVRSLNNCEADTLFLSLAAGAKLLCQEISEELGIRCFDFGSMLRGLTYSATPGNSALRTSHTPFFFRVPLNVYIDALERAFPNISRSDLVVKAQAQVYLELLRKEVMKSVVPEVREPHNFDPNPENLHHFQLSKRHYQERFATFLSQPGEGRQLSRCFDKWCMERGLGVRGVLWSAWRSSRRVLSPAKALLKRISARVSSR